MISELVISMDVEVVRLFGGEGVEKALRPKRLILQRAVVGNYEEATKLFRAFAAKNSHINKNNLHAEMQTAPTAIHLT